MLYTFNDKFIKYNNKCFSGIRTKLGLYYLSDFSSVTENIDQPSFTKTGYKWNLKGGTTTPVDALNTLSSVDGSMPSSFVGKKYRIFNRYKTSYFQLPIENKKFCWQFWAKDIQHSGAGGFMGVRFHFDSNSMFHFTSVSDGIYQLYLKNYSLTAYNGSKYVRDGGCYDTCVAKNTWHFYSIEMDLENKKCYCFSDGIIRIEASFDEFMNELGCTSDGQSYGLKEGITEFAVYEGLKSTGEGADRRYPVPAEPLIQ